MFINKSVIVFLFISTLTFSQAKKKVDTVFVYEKVFVYKSISKKLQPVNFDSITKKRLSEIQPFKIMIVVDTSFLKMTAIAAKKESKKKPKKWFAIDNYGIAVQSLFSQQPEIKNYGLGLGIFATKNLYNNKLFVNFGFSFSKVLGETDIKSVDGYYLTPEGVFQYKPQNSKTQQIDFPVTLSWKYKRIKPQIGLSYTSKKTALDFYAYRNDNVINTIEKASYQLTTNYIDFVYGVEYDVSKRLGFYLKSKQTLSKIGGNNVNKSLKSLEELHFFPNQVIFGVNYNLKK